MMGQQPILHLLLYLPFYPLLNQQLPLLREFQLLKTMQITYAMKTWKSPEAARDEEAISAMEIRCR
jgi:hypothetical protein